MAPKESGFNQSVAASDMTFSMLASRAREGMVKLQRQHFFQYGDTICHPKSGYITTKLHGTSHVDAKIMGSFSDRAIFTFPTGSVCRPR